MLLDAVETPLELQRINVTREQVDRLQEAVAAVPQIELQTQHDFCPGFYARSILIPAGTVLIGKVHATEHIFMVTQGDISITTDEGVMRVRAPFQAICKPGTKRAGYAHEDTVCVNIHITTEIDLAKLEAELIEAPALPAPVQENI